eukprot:gene9262-1665_t
MAHPPLPLGLSQQSHGSLCCPLLSICHFNLDTSAQSSRPASLQPCPPRRLRGMVQDMADNVTFMQVHVRFTCDNGVVLALGPWASTGGGAGKIRPQCSSNEGGGVTLFRESAPGPPVESEGSGANSSADETAALDALEAATVVPLQALYLIPPPGETEWVTAQAAHTYVACAAYTPAPGRSSKKRATGDVEADEAIECDMADDRPFSAQPDSPTASINSELAGAQSAADYTASTALSSRSTVQNMLNLPVPTPRASPFPAAIVKIYEHEAPPILNQLVEFVAILQPMRPGFAPGVGSPQLSEDEYVSGTRICTIKEMDPLWSLAKFQHLPQSLVCTAHVVHQRSGYLFPFSKSPTIAQQTCAVLREQVMRLLTSACAGDSLAAQYVLLNIICGVHDRKPGLVIGQLPVNVYGVSPVQSQNICATISALVQRHTVLSCDPASLTESRWVPHKDHDANQLVSGRLQLPPHTRVTVDETVMQTGTVGAVGAANITSLGKLAEFQKLDYDFGFHEIEFPTDLPLLFLSSQRSIVKEVSCRVALHAASDAGQSALRLSDMPGHELDALRQSVYYVSSIPHTIDEEMSAKVNDDIKKVQSVTPQLLRASSSVIQQAPLHVWFTVARLHSMSLGMNTLTDDTWIQMKDMETRRYMRINPDGDMQ